MVQKLIGQPKKEIRANKTSLRSELQTDTGLEHKSEAASDLERDIQVRSQDESETLWDKFWGSHQNRKSPYHKLIWFLRYRLSRRHAQILSRYSGWSRFSAETTFRILEVGCGSAMTSKYLSESSIQARGFGVDLSSSALKIACEENPGLVCVVADAVAIPFRAGSFSLTFSSGVLEHFHRSEALEMQAEHYRVTKIGGSVGVIVPEKNTPYDLLRKLSGRFWPFGSEKPFSKAELAEFAASRLVVGIKVQASYWITLTAVGVRVGVDQGISINRNPVALKDFVEAEVLNI